MRTTLKIVSKWYEDNKEMYVNNKNLKRQYKYGYTIYSCSFKIFVGKKKFTLNRTHVSDENIFIYFRIIKEDDSL